MSECTFLPIRRNHLLPRAVQSLLRQTHSNWVCELHNDDPNDPLPEQLVAQIDDPRIKYVHHRKNLGAVGSFNLAFKEVSEPFISILEDDNWWESEFLGTMLKMMDAHPQKWACLGPTCGNGERSTTILGRRKAPSGLLTVKLSLHSLRSQTRGEFAMRLHSQGAMLLRSTIRPLIQVPETLPVFAIEPVRERAFPGPFLLYRKPIANFSITEWDGPRRNSRSKHANFGNSGTVFPYECASLR